MSDVHMNLNVFDAIILSVFGLSALIAFFRGFLREFLSLLAWVGAAVATLYLFPHVTELLKPHITNERLASGAGVTISYMLALISFSLLNAVLIRYLKTGMEVGLLDNFLGLFFGALRGAFIVSLAYLILTEVGIAKSDPPEWLKTSITKKYLQKGASFIVTIAPGYLKEIEDVIQKERQREDEDNAKNPALNNDPNSPAPSIIHIPPLTSSPVNQGVASPRGQ